MAAKTTDVWTTTGARRLLNRAGFGSRANEVTEFADRGPQSSIDRLLESQATQSTPPARFSDYTRQTLSRIPAMSHETRREFRRQSRRVIRDLDDWLHVHSQSVLGAQLQKVPIV